MHRDAVLLVTHSGDYFTVDRVAEALARRGAVPFRLDTDRFPQEVQLAATFDHNGRRCLVLDGERRLDLQQVRAVWNRRFWSPVFAEDLDPGYRDLCEAESTALLHGVLRGLTSVVSVNDPVRGSAAEDKLCQLELAADVGLPIPRTLITNDPASLRAFHLELDGRVVGKLLRAVSTSMDASGPSVRTSEIAAEDLEQSAGLRYCPMIFQEQIPKAVELRVVVVGEKLFIGALESADTLDWRRSSAGELAWRHDQVDPLTADRLRALMARLGLLFGAADIIRDPDGREVFLEVNPAGEWGMLERDLELPISEAIAGVLLRNQEVSA